MIKMISLSWFLTLFLSVLPYTTAAHVIDAFFYDGARVLFVLALTILKNNEEYLLDCSDDGEAMIKLTGYFNQILRDDPEYPPRQEVATASKETGAYKSENQPVTIARLLSDAYERFPHITRTANEKMRLHHRLDVRTSTIKKPFPRQSAFILFRFAAGCAKHRGHPDEERSPERAPVYLFRRRRAALPLRGGQERAAGADHGRRRPGGGRCGPRPHPPLLRLISRRLRDLQVCLLAHDAVGSWA